MLGQFSSGYIADRWGGRKIPLVICQAVVSLSYLASALLFSSFPLLVPYLILLSSPFRGGTSPLTNTMVADFSRSEQLAQSFSLLYLGTNIGGVALGPVAASFLYARSIVLLFAFSSLLIFLSTLLLLLGIPKSKTIYTKETANSNKKNCRCPPHPDTLFCVVCTLWSCLCPEHLHIAASVCFLVRGGSAWVESLCVVDDDQCSNCVGCYGLPHHMDA